MSQKQTSEVIRNETGQAFPQDAAQQSGFFQRVALGVTVWTERWFPDAFIFTALAVIAIAAGALIIGASPKSIAVSFGTGFWSLTQRLLLKWVHGSSTPDRSGPAVHAVESERVMARPRHDSA